MPETESEDLIDQFFHLLQQLLLPNWSDLIALLPWVLIALVLGYVAHTAWQWRRAVSDQPPARPSPAGGRRAAARRAHARPVTLAVRGADRRRAPSLCFALPPRDADGNATLPFNPLLLGLGLLVTIVAVCWLADRTRCASGAHRSRGELAAATAGRR